MRLAKGFIDELPILVTEGGEHCVLPIFLKILAIDGCVFVIVVTDIVCVSVVVVTASSQSQLPAAIYA